VVAEFVQDHWVFELALGGGFGERVLSSETNGWSAAFAPRVGLAYSPWGERAKTVIRAGRGGCSTACCRFWRKDFAANPTQVITPFQCRLADWAAGGLHERIYGRAESADKQCFAGRARHDATELYVECWNRARTEEKNWIFAGSVIWIAIRHIFFTEESVHCAGGRAIVFWLWRTRGSSPLSRGGNRLAFCVFIARMK